MISHRRYNALRDDYAALEREVGRLRSVVAGLARRVRDTERERDEAEARLALDCDPFGFSAPILTKHDDDTLTATWPSAHRPDWVKVAPEVIDGWVATNNALVRERDAEAERADRLGEYLSGEQFACHHLRRQLDAVQTVQGMSPAEHARVLSDAQHWRHHTCDQSPDYTIHESSLPPSSDAHREEGAAATDAPPDPPASVGNAGVPSPRSSVTVPLSGRRGGDTPGADGGSPSPSMAAPPPAASAPADGGTVTP